MEVTFLGIALALIIFSTVMGQDIQLSPEQQAILDRCVNLTLSWVLAVHPLPPERCLETDLTNLCPFLCSAGLACPEASDTISLSYDRFTPDLPTDEEVANSLNNLKSNGEPSAFCCQELRPFLELKCPCDPGYREYPAQFGQTAARLEGAAYILSLGCQIPFALCGEVPPLETAAVPPP